MPHSGIAARRRSKNPRTRNRFFDSSAFSRALPGLPPPNRPGGPRRFPALQPPNRPGFDGGTGAPVSGLQTELQAINGTGGNGGIGTSGGFKAFGGVPATDSGGGSGTFLKGADTSPIAAPPAGSLTSALGPGGPFLITSDNPFTQARFAGQVGGGSNIPTIGETTADGTDRQMLEDLRRFDRLGYAKELDRRRGNTLEGTGKTADAARLIATDVQNNPFISVEGLGQLQRGVAPLLGQIDPAFFRHTSPVIVQSLLGLMMSFGLRIEDIVHQQESARPEGF